MSDNNLAVVALDPRDADYIAEQAEFLAADYIEGSYPCRRLRRIAEQIRGAIPAGAS